ncbi:MAG: DUF4097 family beta strand repeat protein [Candidatus Aegiribacteria sp.]|nr:DUF4097 family beta strand repeat protein [Candidatus Aegiribacteria sp.]
MSMSIFRNIVLMLFVLSVIGCGHYEIVYTETHAVPQESTIYVATFNGDIDIEWYHEDEMSLEITKSSWRSEEELEKAEVVIITDSITSITAHKLDDSADVGVSLSLLLPMRTAIRVLETSNGDVTVNDGIGNAEVNTSNGDVTFSNFDGTVDIKTSNGDIIVWGGTLTEAKTSNGSIEAGIYNIPPEGIVLDTSNGNIIIKVLQGLNAQINMDTSNGSITIDAEYLTDVRISDSDGRATLGEGGPIIRLDTSNGDIEVSTIAPE